MCVWLLYVGCWAMGSVAVRLVACLQPGQLVGLAGTSCCVCLAALLCKMRAFTTLSVTRHLCLIYVVLTRAHTHAFLQGQPQWNAAFRCWAGGAAGTAHLQQLLGIRCAVDVRRCCWCCCYEPAVGRH